MIQDIINKAASDKTIAILPSGRIETDRFINIPTGIVVQGCGSHSPDGPHPGTQIVPATGYDGPLIGTLESESYGRPHNTALRDFSVSSSRSDGISFQNSLYGTCVIDNVSAYKNAGNGAYIKGCPALHIGTISAYANGLAGLKLGTVYSAHIGMIAGDNNDCLLETDCNTEASIIIDAFRSERWGINPRQNDIFRLRMRGGSIQIQSGSVHVEADTTGHAWIHALDNLNIDIGFITRRKLKGAIHDGYDYAYINDRTGESYTVAELERRPFYSGKKPVVGKTDKGIE